MKAKIVRQSMFRNDMSLTDISTKNTEQPQREKQGYLEQWAKDLKKLKRWYK